MPQHRVIGTSSVAIPETIPVPTLTTSSFENGHSHHRTQIRLKRKSIDLIKIYNFYIRVQNAQLKGGGAV